jgi:hypothetical protein
MTEEGADLRPIVPPVTVIALEAPVAAVTETETIATKTTTTGTGKGIGTGTEGGGAGLLIGRGVFHRTEEGMIGRGLRRWRTPKGTMTGLTHHPMIIDPSSWMFFLNPKSILLSSGCSKFPVLSKIM